MPGTRLVLPKKEAQANIQDAKRAFTVDCEPLASIALALHVSHCVFSMLISCVVLLYLPTLLLHVTFLNCRSFTRPLYLVHAQQHVSKQHQCWFRHILGIYCCLDKEVQVSMN